LPCVFLKQIKNYIAFSKTNNFQHMQLRYWKNVAPAVDGMQKIAAVAWSPNGKKLAVATSDRVLPPI